MIMPQKQNVRGWINPDEWTRWREILDYAVRRAISVDDAVAELVNAALSHGLDDRCYHPEVAAQTSMACDHVVDSEVEDMNDRETAAAMKVLRAIVALPFAADVDASDCSGTPLIDDTPEKFMLEVAAWIRAYAQVVYEQATR